jgi:hypothetical protein
MLVRVRLLSPTGRIEHHRRTLFTTSAPRAAKLLSTGENALAIVRAVVVMPAVAVH